MVFILVYKNENIKKGILEYSPNEEINVVASCEHYKQAESIKKELNELGFEITCERGLKKLFMIAGRYMSSDVEDIKRKLEELKNSGWEFI
jgi:diphthamide synthase subunit DPH2